MSKKMLNICLIILISLVFIDIVSAETYNNYVESTPISCGNGYLTGIPPFLPKVLNIVYTLIFVAVPIVLVVLGTFDLFKGVSASKEDDIKKGQQMFIKRLISAAIIFFLFIIVKLVVSFVADDSRIIDCADCLINNNC